VPTGGRFAVESREFANAWQKCLTFSNVWQNADPGRKSSMGEFANVWQKRARFANVWQNPKRARPAILPNLGKNRLTLPNIGKIAQMANTTFRFARFYQEAYSSFRPRPPHKELPVIPRSIEPFVRKLAGFYPVVTILGPRQSGKTTLAKALFPSHEYRSLEAEDILVAARDDPRGFLAHGTRPMILDEVQRFPALLTYVQEMADAHPRKGQFVLTGSRQPDLAAAIGESLAGRTGLCELPPLSLGELAGAGLAGSSRDALLFRGFMPRLWADGDAIDPPTFYRDYFQTYVQRDVRRLVNVQDLDAFGVFVRLLAGRAGQLLNRESLARDAGISVPTVVKWLNALEASFLVFRLRPWHANVSSRQVKSPKVYFSEPGLAAWLVGIRDASQIAAHPLVGSLFENLVVGEARKHRLARGLDPDMWFYRNAKGTVEVDLLLESGGRLHPREIKSSSTYSAGFRKGFSKFAEAVPAAAPGKIVYAGRTLGELAVDFRETASWCP